MADPLDFLGSEQVQVIASAVAAMGVVVLAGLPMLRRQEARKRVETVLDYRRELFQEAKARAGTKGKAAQATPDTAKSLADLFRIQRMSGATKIRNFLAAAGFRRPQSVVVYMVARIVLPIVLGLLALLFVTTMKKPLPAGVQTLMVGATALFGFFLPRIYVQNTAIKRKQEIQQRFPDSLDLMLVCVQGGLGVEAALQKVGQDVAENSAVLGQEYGLLSAELAFLGDRAQAFRNFATRNGDNATKSFANALLQAEKYGTSLSTALRVLSGEMRDKRMADAEKKAAALPAQLTVPMICFFMPTLFVVIIGPAGIQIAEAMAN